MKLLLSGVLALMVVGMAGQASAMTNEEVLKEVLAGKSGTFVPSDSEKQIVAITISPYLNYVIDMKAHFCTYAYTIYEGIGSNAHPAFVVRTPMPCQLIKKGYPMVAPAITWND